MVSECLDFKDWHYVVDLEDLRGLEAHLEDSEVIIKDSEWIGNQIK